MWCAYIVIDCINGENIYICVCGMEQESPRIYRTTTDSGGLVCVRSKIRIQIEECNCIYVTNTNKGVKNRGCGGMQILI